MNDPGQVEPWKAYYDENGRIIACADNTLGNQVAVIAPIPHEVNGLALPGHLPGEHTL